MKRREVIDIFISSGYGLVIPPLLEYADSLEKNASEDLNLQTFKLVDQDTGKQLGIRADITSQISRIYSTYNDTNIIDIVILIMLLGPKLLVQKNQEFQYRLEQN